MKAFERHYRILQIINEKRQVTIGYLANELEVSDKTIMRDIWFLSDFLPIRTTPGRYGGGVSYMDDYRYCDYKFYITEEQEQLLNKIINETKSKGVCILSDFELVVLSEIIEKYSKTIIKSKT